MNILEQIIDKIIKGCQDKVKTGILFNVKIFPPNVLRSCRDNPVPGPTYSRYTRMKAAGCPEMVILKRQKRAGAGACPYSYIIYYPDHIASFA
jgi:hypothetical protein